MLKKVTLNFYEYMSVKVDDESLVFFSKKTTKF